MTTPALDNRQWLRSVVERHERPLMQYAVRLAGNLDRARDAVQETLLRLCREDRAKIEDHVGPWLYTVCRSRVLDMRRKDKPMASLESMPVDSPGAAEANPALAVQHSESVGLALQALAALPDNQQEVLRLKFQQGLSYRQIAELTDLSVSNVGFLIHRGLKALRGKLNQPQPS